MCQSSVSSTQPAVSAVLSPENNHAWPSLRPPPRPAATLLLPCTPASQPARPPGCAHGRRWSGSRGCGQLTGPQWLTQWHWAACLRCGSKGHVHHRQSAVKEVREQPGCVVGNRFRSSHSERARGGGAGGGKHTAHVPVRGLRGLRGWLAGWLAGWLRGVMTSHHHFTRRGAHQLSPGQGHACVCPLAMHAWWGSAWLQASFT
jgi:hypothetical protein